MLEESNNRKEAGRRWRLGFSLAIGLVSLAGLIALGGCSRNGANSNATPDSEKVVKNSNATPGSGKVVKNSIGMEFVSVPAGSFQMGSDKGSRAEIPVHQVTFAKGFYMGRYEVTRAQWQKVMDANPSPDKSCGENCPVEQVSWDDAQEFIKKLNAMNDGYTYRLPSEAEWEYACRAGTTGDYAGDLDSMAWYSKNSDGKPHPVGQKQPNAWGLYDMHGNVSEWCEDANHNNYDGAPSDGSAWVTGGDAGLRMARGGSWSENDSILRSAQRGLKSKDTKDVTVGFRVVAVAR